jgi:hypothetical protein
VAQPARNSTSYIVLLLIAASLVLCGCLEQETVQDKYDPDTVKITKLATSLPRVLRFPQRIGNPTLEHDFVQKMLVVKSLKVGCDGCWVASRLLLQHVIGRLQPPPLLPVPLSKLV